VLPASSSPRDLSEPSFEGKRQQATTRIVLGLLLCLGSVKTVL
jgi:hypothetical protein